MTEWLVMGQTPRHHGAKPDDPVISEKSSLLSDFARRKCTITHSMIPTFTLKRGFCTPPLFFMTTGHPMAQHPHIAQSG